MGNARSRINAAERRQEAQFAEYLRGISDEELERELKQISRHPRDEVRRDLLNRGYSEASAEEWLSRIYADSEDGGAGLDTAGGVSQ